MSQIKLSDSFREFLRSIDQADEEADPSLKKLRNLLDTKFKDKEFYEAVSLELFMLTQEHGEATTLWQLFPLAGDGPRTTLREEFGF